MTMLLACGALALAGCGGGDEDKTADTPAPAPAKAADFPRAAGGSMDTILEGVSEGPVLAPSVSVLEKGTNRFAFALFDRARKALPGAQAAVYIAATDGSNARGPFVARAESLEVKPQFRSRQTASDPDSAQGVYVADLPFEADGKHAVIALVRQDGGLVSTNAHPVEVGAKGAKPPAVGAKAPRVHTETAKDVGGNLEQIDTRIPPLRALHESDFADILGRKPAVLVFATPQLCQSRVCGPVVDVTAQVAAATGDSVEFIHQEIYRDNRIDRGFRPAVAQFKLPSEPWAFVVGRNGRVVERFEGAFSVEELTRAVAKVR